MSAILHRNSELITTRIRDLSTNIKAHLALDPKVLVV